MRNWYNRLTTILIKIFHEKKVGHYLWGIDTVFFGQWSLKICSCSMSDITYEELILISFFIFFFFFFIFVGHYLWGIDTFCVKIHIHPVIIIVGHYLWGIDTCIFCIWWLSHFLSFISRTLPMRNWYLSPIRFEIIHEDNFDYVGHYLWGIDTFWNKFHVISVSIQPVSDITYEELIHQSLTINIKLSTANVGHYLWGIDTLACYKECSNKSIIRRTLPMRNWYTRVTITCTCFCRSVGHYLWGIDTVLNCIFWGQWSLVGHYLWGIDTLFLLRHGL